MGESYYRGHSIIYENDKWVYEDTKEPISVVKRPCKRCGEWSTEEGYDACLGYLPGVDSACCGHGVEELYIGRFKWIEGEKILITKRGEKKLLKFIVRIVKVEKELVTVLHYVVDNEGEIVKSFGKKALSENDAVSFSLDERYLRDYLVGKE